MSGSRVSKFMTQNAIYIVLVVLVAAIQFIALISHR